MTITKDTLQLEAIPGAAIEGTHSQAEVMTTHQGAEAHQEEDH